MNDTRCRWMGSTRPRALVGRHHTDCEAEAEECPGCQPCTFAHCRLCGVEHAEGTCPACLAEIRETLTEIRRMFGDLPAEVAYRGVNGEAMNLLGPAADPEARGHWTASVLAGRIVPLDCDARELDDVRSWLEVANHERHPLIVLEGWAMAYRDAFDHDEPSTRVDVWTEAGYLDRNLTYMGDFPHVPFEDFARDLRACRTHMEAVLHDGEQIDEGAPCLKCGRRLVRTWGATGKDDGWECPRCHERSTATQYSLAMRNEYIAHALWLTDADMTVRTQVKAGTVRVWAQRGLVSKRLDSGRVVYLVADVENRRDGDLAS